MANRIKHSNNRDKANLKIEWVSFNESPLAEPLTEKGVSQLVFGACAPEHGLIHVFLDNILKTYGLTGFEPVEDWFTIHSTAVLIHELTHCLAPEWTEEQVGVATERFMEAWFSPKKATRLIIHVGDRTFGHLLTEDNQILEVKG
ncbi:MAG: hypothetical protein QXQ50_02155 [Candidatus Bathyarchaeia archaeon]